MTSGPFDFPACGFGSGVGWPGHRGRRPAHRGHHAGLPGAPRRAGHLRRRRPASACPPASPASGCGRCRPWSAPRRWTGCCASSASRSAPSRGCWAPARPGPTALNVLPYLATSGERAPFVDPLAAGSISGMRLTTNRDDLVRAVCEGLAYTARHCFEAAGRSGRIVVTGGGSKSSNWMQVFADVLRSRWCSPARPRWGPRRRAGGCRGPRRGRSTWRSGPARRGRWSPTKQPRALRRRLRAPDGAAGGR